VPDTILRLEDRGDGADYPHKSAVCRINRTTQGGTHSPI